ncbi:MAG: c-type cytochrome domain-containing protein [Pirellulales bacterium]
MNETSTWQRPFWPLTLAIAVVLLAIAEPAWSAPPTAGQRTQLRTADLALRKAANLYRAGKYAEAGKMAQGAQQALAALSDAESRELAAPTAELKKRLERARELLKAQGVDVPGGDDAPAISFTKQIAPLLVDRCGGCHVQRMRGELSMANFAALAKGSAAGIVVKPGDGKASRIVEMIESGDMPRGGGKVTPDELQLLIAWIDAGAKFDGTDPATPLTAFRPANEGQTTDRPAVVAATGQESVQFSRDLGQVFIDHCLECHGTQNPRAGFSLVTFNGLLQGGNSGATISAGKPADSLLVKKLRGTAGGDQMPMGRAPLPEETLARIEQWIADGARFDAADAAATLEDSVALVAAQRATHDELAKMRAELAEKNWRLFLPDSPPHREESASVLVVGTVGRELLAEVAHIAEEQTAKVARLFRLPENQPLVRGRLTLYVFDKRYDYAELGTMLEARELPAQWRGHWRYTGVDAYGCVLVDGDEVSPGLVAQQIAGVYVASLGKVPRWFAEGTARAAAARLDPKDARQATWDGQVTQLIQTADDPAAFLTAQLPPEDSDVLSYSFVKYLMGGPGRHAQLLAALAAGTSFDEAFLKSYRASPAEIAATWKLRAVSKRGREHGATPARAIQYPRPGAASMRTTSQRPESPTKQ